MNFLPAFYEQIMARIKATVPTIVHIDMDFGQYENFDTDEDTGVPELPFNTPALFIKFETLEMQTLGKRRQASVVKIAATLVCDVVQEISDSTDQSVRNLGHAHSDLIDQVDKYLHAWNGNVPATGFKSFGSFARETVDPYTPNGMMIIHRLGYRSRITVDENMKQFVNPKNMTPPITVIDDITTDIL